MIKRLCRCWKNKGIVDNSTRIAFCICVILRRLQMEFVTEYLTVLKAWVKQQLMQDKVGNEKDLVLIIEYIGALEKPNAEINGFINIWRSVSVSEETIELLKRLTIIVSIWQAEEIRKIIVRLQAM